MWEASLVVDGGSSFKFNDGAIATLEMFDEDALRTVQFHWHCSITNLTIEQLCLTHCTVVLSISPFGQVHIQFKGCQLYFILITEIPVFNSNRRVDHGAFYTVCEDM